MTDCGLVVLLGGSGTRFGGPLPKQFVELPPEGVPLFEVSVHKITAALPISACVLVVAEEHLESAVVVTAVGRLETAFPSVSWSATAGGPTRHMSMRAGVEKLPQELSRVVIHDANRPHLSDALLRRVADGLNDLSEARPCSIPVVGVADSVCEAEGELVTGYVDRNRLQRIQTPQLVLLSALRQAIMKASQDDYTDEGSLMLEAGFTVSHFQGDVENKKITFAADLS